MRHNRRVRIGDVVTVPRMQQSKPYKPGKLSIAIDDVLTAIALAFFGVAVIMTALAWMAAE